MANRHSRARNNRDGDDVQNQGVRGVPEKGSKQIQDASRIWYLDVRPFVIHNRHLRSGEEFAKGCGICIPSVEQVTGIVEGAQPGGIVGQGGGVDEKESTASGCAHATTLFPVSS